MAEILIGNIKGPQGAKGDKGDKGDTGPQGPAGPQGATGPMPALVNGFTTTEAGIAALDAAAGKTLKDEVTQLNSDLNNRNDVTDLLAEADVGINSKRIVNCGANTLNTPFKAGLTNASQGTAYINMANENYGTVIYVVHSRYEIFLRKKESGVWDTNWAKLTTNADIQTEYNVANSNVVFRCEATDGSAIQLATTATQLQLQKRTSATGSWEIVWAK